MRHKLFLLAAAIVATAPAAAFAQSASQQSTIALEANVDQACVLGNPSVAELSLGDLTGPDGRIAAALAGASPAGVATIDVAWCNAPSTLSLDAAPLSLDVVPGYATPTGFSRLITYDATLTGWPASLVDRPVVGDAAKTTQAAAAHAASALELSISRLEALNAAGSGANSTAVIEAGTYTGAIVIGITVQ